MHTSIKPATRQGKAIPPIFDGAILTHTRFDGSDIKDASFEACAAAGASFALAKLVRCKFKDARLHNVDWGQAQILRCNFDDSEMHATSAAYRIPRESLPNRSRETIAVGNSLEGTILDGTVPAFRRDRVLSGIDNHLAWSASTATIILAAMHLPMDPSADWFGQILGHGAYLIGALTLVNMLKEKVTEKLQTHLSDATLKFQLAIRQTSFDLIRRAGNIGNSVVAFLNGPGSKAILKGLRATNGKTHPHAVADTFLKSAIGDIDVVICDRKRMALALEWVSKSYSRTRIMKRDLVVVRTGDVSGDNAPSILKFFANGGMSSIWAKDGKVEKMSSWSADEKLVFSEGFKGSAPGPMECRQKFEQAIVSTHSPGMVLHYDPKTHHLRAGKDGSVVITENRTQLPRNKGNVVLIKSDGGSYNESDARALLREEREESSIPVPN